jgi:hypothetical protein
MDATLVATIDTVLRFVLIGACLVLGAVLSIWQGKATRDNAKAAKDEAAAKLLKAKEPPKQGAAPALGGDVTAPVEKLVDGLATSAPLLAGGIVLLILAGVLTGSLSFTASAGVGDDSGGSQSSSDDSDNSDS